MSGRARMWPMTAIVGSRDLGDLNRDINIRGCFQACMRLPVSQLCSVSLVCQVLTTAYLLNHNISQLLVFVQFASLVNADCECVGSFLFPLRSRSQPTFSPVEPL